MILHMRIESESLGFLSELDGKHVRLLASWLESCRLIHCHLRDGFDLYRSSDIVFKEYISVQSLMDVVADRILSQLGRRER